MRYIAIGSSYNETYLAASIWSSKLAFISSISFGFLTNRAFGFRCTYRSWLSSFLTCFSSQLVFPFVRHSLKENDLYKYCSYSNFWIVIVMQKTWHMLTTIEITLTSICFSNALPSLHLMAQSMKQSDSGTDAYAPGTPAWPQPIPHAVIPTYKWQLY